MSTSISILREYCSKSSSHFSHLVHVRCIYIAEEWTHSLFSKAPFRGTKELNNGDCRLNVIMARLVFLCDFAGTNSTNQIKLALHTLSQNKWSLVTGTITLSYRSFYQEYMVFEDRWSVMAVVNETHMQRLKLQFPRTNNCRCPDNHTCITLVHAVYLNPYWCIPLVYALISIDATAEQYWDSRQPLR